MRGSEKQEPPPAPHELFSGCSPVAVGEEGMGEAYQRSWGVPRSPLRGDGNESRSIELIKGLKG
jgi:hypothetical protein